MPKRSSARRKLDVALAFNGLIYVMMIIAAVPLLGFAIGRSRARSGAPSAVRRCKAQLLGVAGAYYAVLTINYAGVFLLADRGFQTDGMAIFGCSLVAAAPLVTGVLVVLGEVCRHTRSRVECMKCGYRLRGLRSDKCPECGETLRPASGA